MNLDAFVRQRTPEWQELAWLVEGAGRRPERLGPGGVRRLGATYRSSAADLALARRRWPGDPVTVRLEDLVGRSRHLVYAGESRGASLRHFLSRGYWRLVRERLGLVGLCWLLLIVPGVLLGAWAASDPAAAARFLPAEYRGVGGHSRGDLGLAVGTQATLAGQILTNNIQVSFLAFAGGILAGVGTTLVLLFNGALIGGVAGLTVAAGRPGPVRSRFLPAEYRGVGGHSRGDLGLAVGTQATLAGQILTNNIQVSFLAFAGGILAGVGTTLVLLFNGALIGGVAGLTVAAGRPGPF